MQKSYCKISYLLVSHFQSGSIMNASWPVPQGSTDEILMQSSHYLMDSVHNFRLRMKQLASKGNKKKVGQNISEK